MNKSIPQRQHTVNSTIQRERRTSVGDAFSALVVQVLRLHGHLIVAGDTLAKPVGQTSARWQILAAVEHTPASVAQIARAMSLARQSVQRVADVLVQHGLAVYEDNPAHQRAKLLRLTASGRVALTIIQTAQHVWADMLGAEFEEAELRQASSVLERVLQAVVLHPPSGGASPMDGAHDSVVDRSAVAKTRNENDKPI